MRLIKKGQSILELMIVMALLAILLPVLLVGFTSSRSGKAQQQQRLQATALLKEAEEAVRTVRESGWNNIPANGNYYAQPLGSTWELKSIPLETSANINGLNESIVISDAYRNNGVLALSPTPGAIPDASTKKVEITISWEPPYSFNFSPEIFSTLYLVRLDNLSHIETTTTDFTPGSQYGTKINSTIGDGAVVLKENLSNSDWCDPKLEVAPYPVEGNGIGIALTSVAGSSPGQPNYSYITTGDNAASDSLFSLSISNPPKPTPAVPTNFQHYNYHKDYGIFANNSYVFVTSDFPSLTVDIIDKSSFLHSGFYDSGDKPGYSVYVSGNTGYVTSKTKFDAFDVGTIKGSLTQDKLWSINLQGSASGKKVIVSGNYAYIATTATSNSQQLQVVDLTSHSIFTPPSSGTEAINTVTPGVDIAVLNNYAYLITSYSSSSVPDIFVIDISTPTSPKVIGRANTYYLNTSMNPLGIATTPNNKIIVVGDGGYQYQVFDVSTAASPSRCPLDKGQLKDPNGATKINAVSTLTETDGDVYSYILTTNAGSQQFQIIAGGGGGGGGYLTTGTFESKPFEPLSPYSTAFNNFSADVSQSLAAINIQIKVAVAKKVNNCTDPLTIYSYRDPAIIENTNTSIKGTIPFGNLGDYKNPGECFRYQLTLNGDGTNPAPPSFDKITVNYSP